MHHQKNSELTEVKEIKTYSLILSLQFPTEASRRDTAFRRTTSRTVFIEGKMPITTMTMQRKRTQRNPQIFGLITRGLRIS